MPIVYAPPNSNLRIGLDRGDSESSSSESDILSALESAVVSLWRHYDDSIEFIQDGTIGTPHGAFDLFQLRSSDSQWQLRSLIALHDSDGRCVFVGFYSDEPAVSKQQAAYYFQKMIAAKIISI